MCINSGTRLEPDCTRARSSCSATTSQELAARIAARVDGPRRTRRSRRLPHHQGPRRRLGPTVRGPWHTPARRACPNAGSSSRSRTEAVARSDDRSRLQRAHNHDFRHGAPSTRTQYAGIAGLCAPVAHRRTIRECSPEHFRACHRFGQQRGFGTSSASCRHARTLETRAAVTPIGAETPAALTTVATSSVIAPYE